MSGLGISAFLKHTNDSGSRGQWLRDWRKKGVGEITVWLHTRAAIVPTFTHSFMLEDEYQDKETGKAVPVLRYPRFVSPDPEIVHRNQYFRDDDKHMRVPPDRDPFLLLREWLRIADHIGLEEPIFRWENPKDRRVIVWERGVLSGLVKRGKVNFGHSLDTKIEYVYVVVDNDNIDDGPVLMREGKLLSQKISEVIKQQQKQWGDDQGDPMQHPYAFRLIAEDASSPMNAYKAYKDERAEFSDDVWAQISSDEFPDPGPYGQPGDGDMQKIRDAFEAAAQIELPLDEIFSEDSQVRRDLIRGRTRQAAPAAPRASKASQSRQAAAPRPPVPGKAPANKPGSTGAAAPQTGAPARRKKVSAPEPQPEPDVEQIPCDDCGALMLATDTKCESCGAEYEPDADETAPPLQSKPVVAKSTPAEKSKPAAPKPGAPGKPAAPKSRVKQEAAPAPEPEAAGGEDAGCWSCGAPLLGETACPECGIDQGDDIPF